MIRPRLLTSILIALTASLSFLHAQQPSPSPSSVAAPNQEDMRAMRQLLEQQSQKIESLSQQVSKLNQQLETAHPGAVSAPSASPSSPTPAEAHSDPTVKPAMEVKPEATAPKAEPVMAGITPAATPALTHVVAKGETLTFIAKHYKTSVADLLKANKIEDDRKLQIGQVLTIPAPKETENPNEKKGE